MRKALPDCKYNKSVGCEAQKCEKCGWNPKVARERVDLFVKGGAKKNAEAT